MYNRSKIPRLQVMLDEVNENKKVYDLDEHNDEIVKLKEKHLREPGVEENPPPNKKQKRWHNLKEKKRKNVKGFENLETLETKKNVVAQAIEKASNDQDNARDEDKEIREISLCF